MENKMRQSIGLIFVAMLAICPESAWALANPAAVFCAQSGGKSEIRKGPRGQYGMCRLPDGRVVNECLTTGRCTGVECRRAVSTHLRAGSMPLSTAAPAHRPISD